MNIHNHISGNGKSFSLDELIKEYRLMNPTANVINVNAAERCNGIMSERKAAEFAVSTKE